VKFHIALTIAVKRPAYAHFLSNAYFTSPAVLRTFSLFISRLRWLFTVSSLMKSAAPISPLVRSKAISRMISRSRCVSPMYSPSGRFSG